MIHHGHLSTHQHTSSRTVDFEALRLELGEGGRWSEGRWVFLGAGEPLTLSCDIVSEITVDDEVLFPVTIVEPGGTHGPFMVQAMTTVEPSGAHCFLYADRESDGFWVGTTVATSYGRVVLCGYECDPL